MWFIQIGMLENTWDVFQTVFFLTGSGLLTISTAPTLASKFVVIWP